MVRRCLESMTPFKVCGEADDGTNVIELAQKLQPDIILLDLVMPNLNGIQAASVLKKLLPRTKIMLFSFYSDLPGGALAAAAGVDAIVDKSDGLKGILEALQKVAPDSGQTQLTVESPTKPNKPSAAGE